jgi:hypothetical protein
VPALSDSTSKYCANTASVLSPFKAAKATLALNAAVLIFRAILMAGLVSVISLNPLSGFPGPRHDCQNQEASNIKMH